jgi:hypothetical protein
MSASIEVHKLMALDKKLRESELGPGTGTANQTALKQSDAFCAILQFCHAFMPANSSALTSRSSSSGSSNVAARMLKSRQALRSIYAALSDEQRATLSRKDHIARIQSYTFQRLVSELAIVTAAPKKSKSKLTHLVEMCIIAELADTRINSSSADVAAAGGSSAKSGLLEYCLFAAIRRLQLNVVHGLLAAGVNVNSKHNSASALSLAASAGHLPLVMALLDAGALPHARDSRDREPLMLAANVGFLNVAQALVRAGADVNASDYRGRTAISRCANNGKKDVLEYLLQNGGDPNTVNGVVCCSTCCFFFCLRHSLTHINPISHCQQQQYGIAGKFVLRAAAL